MVTVKVTETYDMKTSVGKLGIIGIHTPSGAQIRSLYPGLIKNYKYIRYKKCDVVGACASVLPADPLQVGVTSGTVAPEDMFNPILYKAVTNSSFDMLISRIYDSVNAGQVNPTGSINFSELSVTEANAFKIYYALLGENGKFRKSMPQTGFKIRNLIPICHTLISTYGNVTPLGTVGLADGVGVDAPDVAVPGNLADKSASLPDYTDIYSKGTFAQNTVFRGKSVKMPRIPLHYGTQNFYTTDSIPDMKTFVACMILPPAKLHEFYYRMRVTWTISFEGLTSALAYYPLSDAVLTGTNSYGTQYTYESSKAVLGDTTDSIDSNGVDVEKIMES